MRRAHLAILVLLFLSMELFAMANGEEGGPQTWPEREITIVCPWAVGGVADIVSRSLSPYVSEELGVAILNTNELGAGGNVALSNYAISPKNDYKFILGCEGPFAISQNLEGSEVLLFDYSDYESVINFYSSIMILTANSKLGLRTLEDIERYGKEHKITVAVNGVTGAEAFLIRSVLESMDLEYVLVNYNGANLALAAASRGETALAVSHQSQALLAVENGSLIPILVFDEKRTDNDPFKDVPSLKELGYETYFPNTACLMARKDTDPVIIERLRDAYLKAIEEDEISSLYDNLLIEKDPMLDGLYDEHIAKVDEIVKGALDV